MALERPPGAMGFMFRVKMQHDPRDFTPVSTVRIRVKQAQIRDEVFLVVNGQHGIGGRGIGDIGIKRRLLHGRSRNGLLIHQVCFGFLGILMTVKASSLLNIRDVLLTRPWHSRNPRGPHGHPYSLQLKCGHGHPDELCWI